MQPCFTYMAFLLETDQITTSLSIRVINKFIHEFLLLEAIIAPVCYGYRNDKLRGITDNL